MSGSRIGQQAKLGIERRGRPTLLTQKNLRKLARLICGIGVVLARLVVTYTESRAAAIAELERFDRVGRIFRDLFVENSYRTVQIVCHVILRWG